MTSRGQTSLQQYIVDTINRSTSLSSINILKYYSEIIKDLPLILNSQKIRYNSSIKVLLHRTIFNPIFNSIWYCCPGKPYSVLFTGYDFPSNYPNNIKLSFHTVQTFHWYVKNQMGKFYHIAPPLIRQQQWQGSWLGTSTWIWGKLKLALRSQPSHLFKVYLFNTFSSFV